MNRLRDLSLFFILIAVSGCAAIPPGPSVMALPPPGKSKESFQADDLSCREWAEYQSEWEENEKANQYLASQALIGALIGAGLGAAIGSASGNMGAGAAIGAAGGLIAGSAANNHAYETMDEVQWRYDLAYQQCMYSKGNQISDFVQESRRIS